MKRTIILTAGLTLLHASLAQAQPQHLRWNIELSTAPTCWDDGQNPSCTNGNLPTGTFADGGGWQTTGLRLSLSQRTMITNLNGVGGAFLPNFWAGAYSAAIHVWNNEAAFAADPHNGDHYSQIGVVLLEDPPLDFPGSSSGEGWNNFYTTFLFNEFPLEAGDYIVAAIITTSVQFYFSESDVPLTTGPDIFAYSGEPGQWFEISSFPGRPTGTAAADILGCPEMPGDINFDCYVDLDDFTIFAGCMAGPDVTKPPPGCDPADFAAADLEGQDNDVDMADFAAFQTAFTGPAP